MKEEILRLFKGFLGEKSDTLNERALAYGLVIPATASEDVVNEAIKQYGKDSVLWNQTFHKDWKTVAETPMAVLVLQQIMHYFTTYGFEALGIYDESTVYVPAEALDVPDLDPKGIKLTVINALTEDEVKTRIMNLITSGIALSDQTVKDVKVLSDFIDKTRFDEVANREVRTFLYDKYNVMPRNPEAFLRYLMFKLTGATLKIQNVATYNALQHSNKETALRMLEAYGDYAALSSIFLRNKNLFLALKAEVASGDKTQARINTIINKLRKLATTNHKPLKKAVLDSLTSDFTLTEDAIIAALDKVTAFREIRLLNSLNYRINGKSDIVYRVRNGKSYVSTIDTKDTVVIGNATLDKQATMQNYYNIVRKHLVNRISAKVANKTLYVPEGVFYKAPATEKQFVNNVPDGSYFELPANTPLIFATHWTNLSTKDANPGRSGWGYSYDGSRVDLDMRMMNQTTNIGWNSSYRSGDRDILFSGDITDAPAPKGATEAIYVGKDVRNQSFMITLNDFTCHSVEVPYEFIVAAGDKGSFGKDYVIDPNKIISKFNLKITPDQHQITLISKFNLKITPDQHQITLGQVRATETTKRFYFSNYAVGVSGAVSRQDKYTMGALSYMETFNELQVSLNELLIEAGAIVSKTPTYEILVEKTAEDGTVTRVKEERPVDIDLSVEAISKDTIINLFN